MLRSEIENSLINELNLNEGTQKELKNFLNDNAKLSDFEFYKKLHETYPWIEMMIKLKTIKQLFWIKAFLAFFTILTILGIIGYWVNSHGH